MIVLLDSLKFIHEQCDSFSGLIKRDYDKSVDVLKKFQKQVTSFLSKWLICALLSIWESFYHSNILCQVSKVFAIYKFLICSLLSDFLFQIRTEKLFCLVFQFAVCTSREEMHKQLQELLESTVMEVKPPDEQKKEEGGAPPPPLGQY